jgi:aspartyl-tRNA(Asn)/glutamyl-tRNA(Gln) amidotransferase subunit C
LKITEQEVCYVAGLANLHLSPEEIARMQRDLNGILTHMERLNEIDTAGIEPMAQVLFGESDTLRTDSPGPTLDDRTALQNAPLSGAGHFKVPKIIER